MACSSNGLLKQLAGNLIAEDLKNLAATSCALRNDIRGHDVRFKQLIASTICCDGSSGDVWRSEWTDNIKKDGRVYRRNERATTIHSLLPLDRQEILQRHDHALAQVACQSQSAGPIASKRCHLCEKPVCNVRHRQMSFLRLVYLLMDLQKACRFHNSYSVASAQDQPLLFHDEVAGPTNNEWPAEWMFMQLLYSDDHRELYVTRWHVYCDVCLPDVQASMPNDEHGSPEPCECEYGGSHALHLKEWTCVPCFKRAISERKSRVQYICANRRKTEGCVGAGTGKVKICRWCNCEVKGRY